VTDRSPATAGPILLVTGGSRGIGAATARLAAGRGWRVCINYRADHGAAESVVASITAAGGLAIAVAADISIESDVVRLFETCDRELGTLAALVNNAGILETQMRLDATDAERIRRIFATNVTGAFVCAREAVRRMSTRHGGRGGTIVNVSSGAPSSGCSRTRRRSRPGRSWT
jgi:NAD(P)-dependent dehydrogenase (short-subunit alcohol dehydrogenase family)